MQCRQTVYSKAKAALGIPLPIADLVRDNPEFKSAELYRAARSLVTHGILTREDISWPILGKNKEKTLYRCAVRFVEPFTVDSSRKW